VRDAPKKFTHATRRAAVCFAFIAIATLTPATAAAEWRRLDSPNFIVIGDASANELRDIAFQFEGFRETLSRVLSTRATATAVPTVVIVFPNDRAFTPFKRLYQGKPVAAAGNFYGDRDVNYITVLNDGRPDAMRVIFHEYAHLVVANVAMNLPAWLNEGLAEYYSTYELSRGGREASIGRPVESHLRVLAKYPLLPMEQLIQVDRTSPLYNEGERRSVFYAQSWALTHMLLLGDPPRLNELASFIRHKQNGLPEIEAWQRAFGAASLERDLKAYVRRQTFKTYQFRFAEKLAPLDATAVPMAEPDVQSMLAALYVRQKRLSDAERLLAGAFKADSGNSHANAVMARIEIEKGAFLPAAKRLISIGAVDDWFVAYAAGTALSDLIDRARDPSAVNLQAARAQFDAVRRQRELPNVLAHLAMLDVMAPAGASADGRAFIERARTLAPGRDDYALIHARLLSELGEFALAKASLGPLMAPGFPPHIRETAQSWMGNVVRSEEARRTAAERRAAILRPRKPGEQRLDGRLERIDCPAAAPATFYVRTADGTETLIAPKLGDVQFITYRQDFAGSMICGPLKEPLPVHVTWTIGDPPGTRHVVAVEFYR
jgi:hypothetical protein